MKAFVCAGAVHEPRLCHSGSLPRGGEPESITLSRRLSIPGSPLLARAPE
jgi:hypothetical protein